MKKLTRAMVDRYLAGEATDAEAAIVESWLSHSPAFRIVLAEIRAGILDEEHIRLAEADVWARFELGIPPETARPENDGRAVPAAGIVDTSSDTPSRPPPCCWWSLAPRWRCGGGPSSGLHRALHGGAIAS